MFCWETAIENMVKGETPQTRYAEATGRAEKGNLGEEL